MPLTSRHVIGIEEKCIGGMGRSIARTGWGQNEGFKKPTGVRQMPFRRAHIRHRLDDIIFRHQRLAEPLRKVAHLMVTPDQALAERSLTETTEDSRAMGIVVDTHITLLFNLSSPRHRTTPRLASCPDATSRTRQINRACALERHKL